MEHTMNEEGIKAILESLNTLTRLVAKIADEIAAPLGKQVEEIKIILVEKRREEMEARKRFTAPGRDGDKYPPPRLKRGNDPPDAA